MQKKIRKATKRRKRAPFKSENHRLSGRWKKLLPALLAERIQDHAKSRGCSVVWLIENMIHDWLTEHETWKKSIPQDGTITGAIADAAAKKRLGHSRGRQGEPNTSVNDAITENAKLKAVGSNGSVSRELRAHDPREPRGSQVR